jgi:PAS domain S-box-containing protein
VVDITERRQAVDKMRISEIRYRRLFETANDGLILLDPVTRKITEVNPFMTTLLGYSHDQLIGKELFEIGLLKDEGTSQEMFQKLKRKHEVRYEDLPLESQTGRHQEVEVVANLYQENGHSVIQCNIRDITQRKETENALTRMAAIIQSSDDAIIGKDLSGIITNWNNGALRIFGYTEKEILGKSIMKLIPEGRADEENKILEKIKSGKSVENFETKRKTKAGRLIDVSVTVSPIKDASGRVAGVSTVARDITEQKRSEAAQRRIDVLAASNQKLENEIIRRQAVEESLRKSERHQIGLLEQSHEMQAQLRQLSRQILHAQEEERKRISRELHDVIAQTLTGINIRLATLKIEAGSNIKGFSRNLVRTQRLVGKSVDIVHRFARELRPAVLDDLGLIPALHSFMENFTAETGVRTYLTAFAGVEKLDTIRRTALFRVTQEALTNVYRHARASQAKVSIQKQSNRICLKITDDGKSFNVEDALRAKGGKRLGLLGMRERLEMVDGNFHVESTPGKGTTITAQIPFRKARLPGKSPRSMSKRSKS